MVKQTPGDTVSYTYHAGLIALSYVVSAVGCWTALELLHRRTSRGGVSNWLLLAGAATAMGAVAIWSMHFIGMQAITMGAGEPELQITYSATFTTGSFFLPIAVVAIAFFIFSASDVANVVNIVFGGVIAGVAICGMHFVAILGVRNYTTTFDYRLVAAAVVIAVVSASVSFGVFFRLRFTWTNAIWKRGGVALALATATSLTHWTWCLGTSYQWRGVQEGPIGLRSATAIGICGGLAFVCCGVLVTFALFWQRVRRLYASRAQQVVVATATWDPEGRLLLNSGGLLPCQKVTNNYIERSFKDDFTIDHPVFAWIYRVSTNWYSVTSLVAGMKKNLHDEDDLRVDAAPGARGDSAEMAEDFAGIFKQLFCVAAQSLALSMQARLEDVGVLFDRIIDTGTVSPRMKLFRPHTPSLFDTESGRSQMSTLGRGQLLFLVRHVSKAEASRLQSSGFKFAPVPMVLDQLSHSMQITSQELLPHLEDLRAYRDVPRPMRPGVHLACFALRPVVGRTFDILADRHARNLLPSVELQIPRLEPAHAAALLELDNWEVSKLQRHWAAQSQSSRAGLVTEHTVFVAAMQTALSALSYRIGADLFKTARLIARPFHGPVAAVTAAAAAAPDCAPETPPATVIALRLMCDIHRALPPFALDEFVPCRFFLAAQYAYRGSPDHCAFASRVYREFGGLEQPEPPDTTPGSPADPTARQIPLLGRRPSATLSSLTQPLAAVGGRSRLSLVRGHLTQHQQRGQSSYSWLQFGGGAGARSANESADSLSEKGLVRVRSITVGSSSPRSPRSPVTGTGAYGLPAPPAPTLLGGVHVSKEVSVVSEAPRGGGRGHEDGGAEAGGALGVCTEIGTAREAESMMDELMGLALGGLAPSQP